MCAPSSKAFSLAETIIVVLVMGILGSVLLCGFSNLVPLGRQEAAVGKARILNAARCSYALTVPDAATQWTSAASDEARFNLLVEARLMDGSAADYLSSSGNYAFLLTGALRAPTQILKNGSPFSYTP